MVPSTTSEIHTTTDGSCRSTWAGWPIKPTMTTRLMTTITTSRMAAMKAPTSQRV